MKSLPMIATRASSISAKLADCAGCTVCCERGGLVYVSDMEVATLRGLGVPLFRIDGVTFIERNRDGSCPMLDREQKNCTIYENRPLCCRLFPLDVLSIDRKLTWALSNLCPDDRRGYGLAQGPVSRLGTGTVGRLASVLDSALERDELEFFKKKERVAGRLEMLDEEAGDWTPVARCADNEAS